MLCFAYYRIVFLPVSLKLYAYFELGGFIKNLWHERAVGLKLHGFEIDPELLAASIPIASEYHRTGDPHGKRNHYRQNQIYIAKVFKREDYFDEIFLSLVEELGGLNKLKKIIQEIKPQSGGVLVNLPVTDIYSGMGSGIGKNCISLLTELGYDFGINYF